MFDVWKEVFFFFLGKIEVENEYRVGVGLNARILQTLVDKLLHFRSLK